MIYLIYMSSATRPFSEADLIALLKKARVNNSNLNITGMLLYKEGNFLQLLEGEESAVMNLYEFIKTNTDHHSATILDKGTISERQFGDWSMGFFNLNDETLKNHPGYSQFMNNSFTVDAFSAAPNEYLQLLQLFRDTM